MNTVLVRRQAFPLHAAAVGQLRAVEGHIAFAEDFSAVIQLLRGQRCRALAHHLTRGGEVVTDIRRQFPLAYQRSLVLPVIRRDRHLLSLLGSLRGDIARIDGQRAAAQRPGCGSGGEGIAKERQTLRSLPQTVVG
ncbi:Uncharacterised protein [Yokenella regensburgei]|uniref:Uncharacterized protein n=1 Tax=Yokenella regensburgei TaxID=158877 RepID=A0AB38FTI2_9ENTR|nr:Uncharacterised protein [Yokenella regensburgei]